MTDQISHQLYAECMVLLRILALWTFSWVFFNTGVLTQKGCIHIKEHLPENLRHQVVFIHAGRSARAKRKVMQDFRAGIIRILCASEAAAMVCITIYDLLC